MTCCPRGGETGNCDGKGLIFVIGSLDRWHMVVCLSLIKPTLVVFALINSIDDKTRAEVDAII